MTGPVRDVFTASNGYEVRTDADGDVFVFNQRGLNSIEDGSYLNHNDLDALREFFQHERDKELGRWRWPEHPEYVVYAHQGQSLGGRDLVNVINESCDEQYTFERIQRRPDSFLPGSPTAAAVAYFEAHPEPKPWENAKEGEVWVIEWNGGTESAYIVPSTGWDRHMAVKSARRIWPEGDR